MPSIADILAAFALALPMVGAGASAVSADPEPSLPTAALAASEAVAVSGDKPAAVAEAPGPAGTSKATSLEALRGALILGQIRVERRVFIRIGPRSFSNRRNMLAQLPVRTRRYKERKAERCVQVEQIMGVETGSGNRLLLFLEEAEIMSVSLEKACRARDFYSGFYVDQNEDGKLCAERDTLQSRNGARCDIERIMELVAVED